MVRLVGILTALFGTLLLTAVAEARSVALVLGNQKYAHLESLEKSAADAAGYADVLKAKGFDDVILKQDLTRFEMDEAIADFIGRIDKGDTAVFVYSGHGWSDGSQNYIIGTDAPASASADLLARLSIPVANGLNGIVDEMTRKGAGLKVAIVDACRDNPFRPQVAGKGVGLGKGFNRMKEEPPDGTFMVFSAGAGQVALDRLSEADADPNGVFTRTFLPLLRTDMTLLDATKAAQDQVFQLARTIGHDQLPAYYDQVRGKACLAGTCEGPSPSPAAVAPVDPIAADYALAEQAATAEVWDAFLAKHGSDTSNFYVQLARSARQKLAALPPEPKKPPPAIAAETCPDGALASIGETGAAAKRCLKGGDSFKDCGDCPHMVVIPPGSFNMGSPLTEDERFDFEGPVHRVTIRKSFAVAKFEVTRRQFGYFAGETAYRATATCNTFEKGRWDVRSGRSWSHPGISQTDDDPVVCLSLEDAKAYLRWLSGKSGHEYRLLSEAEWEYAARAGTDTAFYTGSTITPQDASYDTRFTYRGGPKAPFRGRTMPVGSYRANPFGLFDMLGNVWEWVDDCYETDYSAAPTDGSSWRSGDCETGLLRGGSWFSKPLELRSAVRLQYPNAWEPASITGFRVARTLS